MPLLHSRLIRWRVTKLVNSIEITSAEWDAGQQLHGRVNKAHSMNQSSVLHSTCHLNLVSAWLWSRFILQIRILFGRFKISNQFDFECWRKSGHTEEPCSSSTGGDTNREKMQTPHRKDYQL